MANAYRGELLGLMAVHLLLLAVKTVSPGLSGSATIYSDCIGALGRVAKLPPYRIQSMPALGHPKDHYGQLCQPILPAGVGGYEPSHATQFGMRLKGKGNSTLPGCNKSSPAGGILARNYLHVCRRKEDDVRYGCAHTIRSRTSDCTVLLSPDKQDVHGRVRRGRLASCAPDPERGGAPTVSGQGL